MKAQNLLFLVVLIMVVGLFGCNKADKQMSQALEKAQGKLVALKKAENGSEAMKLMMDVVAAKPNPKLSQSDWLIKVGAMDQQELEGYVKDAYAREALSLARVLGKIKANPKMAMDYREKFLEASNLSGRNMASFGMSKEKLDRIVVSNLNDVGIATPQKVIHKVAKTKPAVKTAGKKKQHKQKVRVAKAP